MECNCSRDGTALEQGCQAQEIAAFVQLLMFVLAGTGGCCLYSHSLGSW